MALPRALALLALLVALFAASAHAETPEFEATWNQLAEQTATHLIGRGRSLAKAFNCAGVVELSVIGVQTLYFQKKLTAVQLLACYLQRIADYSSPKTFKKSKTPYAVNAFIELNPEAYQLARTADRILSRCKVVACKGPMFGIFVTLKDIVAADPMNNTAGSYALLGCHHPESTVATKIKGVGGIILGKAGLSEWANSRGSSVSGWSARNGQVFDPYVRYILRNVTVLPDPYGDAIPTAIPNGTYNNVLNPTIVSGSSSGSAVVAAVSLSTVTIGTETSGSILSPSGAQALVGIKPTVGLVSRFGIVPISHSQDTAGPICRTVSDAAYLLDTIHGVDYKDEDTLTQIGTTPAGGYRTFLKTGAFKGAVFAAAPLSPFSTDSNVYADYISSIQKIRELGATVDLYPYTGDSNTPLPGQNITTLASITGTDLKYDLSNYFAGCTWAKGSEPLLTLADVIRFNKEHYQLEFQGGTCCRGDPAYGNFFQQGFEADELTNGFYDPNYLGSKQNASIAALAIVAFYNGGNPFNRTYDALIHNGGFIGTYARARYPSITVPGALSTLGAPSGFIFSGLPYTEGKLISYAYDYEQRINLGKRPLPTFCNSYTC